MTEFLPQSVNEVVDAVREAAAQKSAFRIEGRGSKRNWGRPTGVDHVLSLRKMSGILSYQPEELVLTALAGTPLREIETALRAKAQHLAFEPVDFGPVFGGEDQGTLGGVLACNLSGPRRPSAGAARDHFLGFTAVNGTGDIFKAGGKVVKNVTGYDLPKLMAGSFGTLAVMTEVTVKVLPAPEDQCSVLFDFSDVASAHRFMLDALQGAFEIDGAALLPAEAVTRSGRQADNAFQVALRLSGSRPSIEARAQALCGMARGRDQILQQSQSRPLWCAIRDLTILTSDPASNIWRISVPASDGAAVLQRLQAAYPVLDWMMDWGGSLIWAALPADAADQPRRISTTIAAGRGHAALLRGSEDLRRSSAGFQLSPPQSQLMAAVKRAFDPDGVLNPKRMHPDW